jgi:LPXTG-motif cell wall-anchored protein
VAFFAAHVAANGADLAVTATSASGAVGAVVKITVTVENHGDASSPDTTLTVTAPTGTELVDMPTNCVFVTAGKVGKCEGLLSANEKSAGQFSFKIASTSVAKDGKAHIEGPLFDKVPANNDAAIVITIDNGLPITGAKVSVIAGTGAAVLLAGALLFFLARRRRVVLVTPSRDA